MAAPSIDDPLHGLRVADTPACVIFVPGHWHTVELLVPLISIAAKLNLDVTPHQLASVGRKPVRPTFADDVAGIRRSVIAKLDGGDDVVLVLHGHAGMPGSEAVNQLVEIGALQHARHDVKTGRLRRVIYISAYINAIGCMKEAEMPLTGLEPLSNADFNNAFMNVGDPRRAVFNDPASNRNAQPSLAALEKTHHIGAATCLTSDKYRQAPLLYLRCEKDVVIPLEHQVEMSTGMPSLTLNTGHDPFITQSEELLRILAKAAMSA